MGEFEYLILRPGPFRVGRPDWTNCGAAGAAVATGAAGATGDPAGSAGTADAAGDDDDDDDAAVPVPCYDCWLHSTSSAANLSMHQVHLVHGRCCWMFHDTGQVLWTLPGLEALESIS